MAKEPLRRCSHCGHNGHNSRTCNGRVCIKLFGVKINVFTDDEHGQRENESIRKCKSTGNLPAASSNNNGETTAVADAGYLSDGLIQSSQAKAAHERKKANPWTEEEHRSFLIGLEQLGKGDWRGISRNYVPTRTPTQVASHAQKYFIRLAANEKNKRKASVFDIDINHVAPLGEVPNEYALEAAKQANTATAHVSSFERPPLAPAMGRSYDGGFGYSCMPYPYMMGASSSRAGTNSWLPAVSFAPQVRNFPAGYVPNIYGRYSAAAPLMAAQQPPSNVFAPQMLPPPPHHLVASQRSAAPPAAAAPLNNNKNGNGLDRSIGALTL